MELIEIEEEDEKDETEPINNYGTLTNTIMLPVPKVIDGDTSKLSEEDEEVADPFRGKAISRPPKIVQKKAHGNVNKKLFQEEEEENLSDNQNENMKPAPYLGVTNQREFQSGVIKEESKVVSRVNSSHKEIKVMRPPPLDEEKKNLIVAAAAEGQGIL